MATPTIKIDQVDAGPGTPETSRDDLVVGKLVTCTDPANGGGTYLWTVTLPVGSSTILYGASTSTLTFTPDIAGTYLVYLLFNGTDASYTTNVAGWPESTQGGAGVKLPDGQRIPGTGETLQFGTAGWATPADNHFRAVPVVQDGGVALGNPPHTTINFVGATVTEDGAGTVTVTVSGGPGGGVGGTGDTFVHTVRAADTESHASTTPLVVSQFQLDPSEYALTGATLSLVFRAVASVNTVTASGKAQLYSVSDSEYIGSGVTFTSETPAKAEEALTVGAGAGQVDNAAKIYETRIWTTTSGATDAIELGSAEVRVINTVD